MFESCQWNAPKVPFLRQRTCRRQATSQSKLEKLSHHAAASVHGGVCARLNSKTQYRLKPVCVPNRNPSVGLEGAKL
jgi:hypothetical protein